MVSASKFLIVATLLAQGLTVGTFFAFSTFVMPALARLAPGESVRAMRSINATILGSPFMAAFALSAILAIALPLADRWNAGKWNPLLVACAATYLVGTIGTTIAGNVPLNDALAGSAASSDEAAWRAYFGPWTMWNHVRTLAGAASIVDVAWDAIRDR